MRSEYDVIVVGAGPAGSTAAAEAARHGLDVLLIEKRQEIGEPVRCAEGIFKDGLEDFISYDPKWVCAEISRARIYAPDGSVLCFSQQGDGVAGYVLERKLFDRALAKQAAEAGSEVYVKTQATGLIIEGGVVKGIKGIRDGKGFYARSKVVIGADGVESKVGRWAGLIGPIRLVDIESCAEFMISDVDVDAGCLELYFGNEVSPGGYAWVFPKGNKEANVGLGILGSRFNGVRPIQYLKKFVDKRFPGCDVVQAIAGAVPVCDVRHRISTGGLMLAGDGARLVDPLLGAGIMNAMISGRMAGNVAAQAIKSGDVSSQALQKYDVQIRQGIGKAIRRNYKIKQFVVKATDSQMNKLLRSLQKTDIESVPVSKIYRTVTTSGLPAIKIIKAFL